MKGIQANAEDAVLAGFNPTISLNVGGSRAFPLVEALCKTKSYLARNPASFVWGGVALSVYLSQKLGRSPNLKNKK